MPTDQIEKGDQVTDGIVEGYVTRCGAERVLVRRSLREGKLVSSWIERSSLQIVHKRTVFLV